MKRKVRLAYSALGLILLIIGLPTISDGIAGWADWLGWLGEREWQWPLFLLGLLIIAATNLPDLYRRLRPPAQRKAEPKPLEALPPDSASPRLEQQPDEVMPAEILVGQLPPPAAAVWAERTRRSRIADLVLARVEQVRELRAAFDEFIETFLARRAEYRDGMNAEQLERAREEYGRLQRRAAAAYRQVRDHYRRFLRDEPQYDRSSNDQLDYVAEEPLPDWWAALTFDAAIERYTYADDDHIRRYVAEERAILEAFTEWIAEPRHHELAADFEGANVEDVEILDLIRRRVEARERERVAWLQRATLSARQGSISGREFGDQYNFEVMNTGQAAARTPRAWAAAPPNGPPLTGTVQMDTLPPDHRWYAVMLEIGRTAFPDEGLELVVAWDDDSGPREERILGIRPLQR